MVEIARRLFEPARIDQISLDIERLYREDCRAIKRPFHNYKAHLNKCDRLQKIKPP